MPKIGYGLPVAQTVKALAVPNLGAHPIDEAISLAGGITLSAVANGPEMRAVHGLYV